MFDRVQKDLFRSWWRRGGVHSAGGGDGWIGGEYMGRGRRRRAELGRWASRDECRLEQVNRSYFPIDASQAGRDDESIKDDGKQLDARRKQRERS